MEITGMEAFLVMWILAWFVLSEIAGRRNE